MEAEVLEESDATFRPARGAMSIYICILPSFRARVSQGARPKMWR